MYLTSSNAVADSECENCAELSQSKDRQECPDEIVTHFKSKTIIVPLLEYEFRMCVAVLSRYAH